MRTARPAFRAGVHTRARVRVGVGALFVGLIGVPLGGVTPVAVYGSPLPGAAVAAAPGAVALHELHETYADLAIEGGTVAGRLRFYKKDLERALGPLLDVDAVSLSPGPEADALLLRYLRDRLALEAHGAALDLTLLRAEEIRMEHHAGWEVTLSWQATSPVACLRVRNTLLFELHDDQRNIMRFVRLPEERTVTFYFARDEQEHLVRVQASS